MAMKSDQRTDEEFSRLAQGFVFHEPEFKCDSSNHITRVCTNIKCLKPALYCNSLQCQKCHQEHKKCYNVLLSAITDLINSRTQGQKAFIYGMFKIEEAIIDAIHKSRREIFEKFSLGDLEQKYLDFIVQIYSSKNQGSVSIKGKETYQLYQRLQQSRADRQAAEAILLKNYEKQSKKVIQELLHLKKEIFSSFVNQSIKKKDISFEMQSKILEIQPLLKILEINKLPQEQLQFIKQSLNKPLKLELLFRASQNEFSAAKFHQKCDNVSNTLTLIRNNFGKTMAGFTPNPWKNDGAYQHDNTNNTFLLSLDLKQKMKNTSTQNVIYCPPNYGPTFGDGHDLYLADKCNANMSSYCNFPYRFNCNGQYSSGQASFTAFCGAVSGYNYSVLEYEVFRVIY